MIVEASLCSILQHISFTFYFQALKKIDLTGICHPALSFNYINLGEIQSALRRPRDFSAVMITSQNGARGLERALAEHQATEGNVKQSPLTVLITMYINVCSNFSHAM